MNSPMTRRHWLALAPGAVVLSRTGDLAAFAAEPDRNALSAKPNLGGAAPPDVKKPPKLHNAFPAQDPALVREVVGASHFNIDRVRELVEASPALAKANWDWGFGDWESALGAASHVGRPDIAELLIKHGARPNVFTFAMLGRLDAVKACVAAMPGVQRIHGPHGITLLEHARNGGDDAKAVVDYLESLGDAGTRATSLDVSDEQKKIYFGRYSFGDGPEDVLEVKLHRRGDLTIQRGQDAPRVLNRVEEHGFAPAGATAVRIRFNVKDGRAVALTVHDPAPMVTAVRLG